MSSDPQKPGGSSDQQNDRDLSQRLDRLNDRLKEENERHAPPAQNGDKTGVALAMRLSSEFIAGVVVGGAIGFGIDQLFGTAPWGLIVFLMLGFVAAIVNILRSAGMMAESGMRLNKARELAEKSRDNDTDGSR